jgi:formyl-CoA transferase/CoA:oxalate CoA-transferase
VDHRTELRAILAARFAERSTAEWLADLETAEVPAGAIDDVMTAFTSPAAAALEMLAEVEHPALGVLRQAGIPIRFERTPGAVRTAPPLLGEQTDEILSELGYGRDDVERMRASGAI